MAGIFVGCCCLEPSQTGLSHHSSDYHHDRIDSVAPFCHCSIDPVVGGAGAGYRRWHQAPFNAAPLKPPDITTRFQNLPTRARAYTVCARKTQCPPLPGRGLKSFIDVFYHQVRNGIQGHTTRAPPLSRGGRVRTGDQTIASPMP